jgi:uncharacterized protein (DUF1778 family)
MMLHRDLDGFPGTKIAMYGESPYDKLSKGEINMSKTTNSARIDARLPQSVLDLIKRAADMQGRAVSDFVVTSAREAAEQAIEKQSMIQLSLAEQKRFAKGLNAPVKPNAAMRKAAKLHERLVQSDLDRVASD